jgi:uncharacterized membrane protein YfcA
LSGIRYSGKPRPATSLVLGSVVGVLLGATSVGAPPVILYLLSGPDPQVVTRANLTVFVTAISVVGLAMLVIAGAATASLAQLAAMLTVPFLLATWLGAKAFNMLSDIAVRRVSLGMMLVMGTVGLAF